MRLDRMLIAVPLIGGALLTGTAFAHGVGVSPTVRDTVYSGSGSGSESQSQPRCQHNGVSYNKQGHANCGLHKGWGGDAGAASGEPTSPDAPGTVGSTDSGTHGHKADHASGKGGRSADHRPAGSHGRPASPGKSGSHGPAGTHGSPTTRHGSGTHGHGGGKGHAKHGG
jgi:hypothetical protein